MLEIPSVARDDGVELHLKRALAQARVFEVVPPRSQRRADCFPPPIKPMWANFLTVAKRFFASAAKPGLPPSVIG